MEDVKKAVQLLEQLNCKMDKVINLLEKNQEISDEANIDLILSRFKKIISGEIAVLADDTQPVPKR